MSIQGLIVLQTDRLELLSHSSVSLTCRNFSMRHSKQESCKLIIRKTCPVMSGVSITQTQCATQTNISLRFLRPRSQSCANLVKKHRMPCIEPLQEENIYSIILFYLMSAKNGTKKSTGNRITTRCTTVSHLTLLFTHFLFHKFQAKSLSSCTSVITTTGEHSKDSAINLETLVARVVGSQNPDHSNLMWELSTKDVSKMIYQKAFVSD